MTDELIIGFDRALRTLAGTASARAAQSRRPAMPESTLTPEERRHAGGLMRVNHTGEVCAQALYQAQALTARDPAVRRRFARGRARGGRPSRVDAAASCRARRPDELANPFWYAGSFAIGLVAGHRRRPHQPRIRRRDRAAGRGAPDRAHGPPAAPATRRAARSSPRCATTRARHGASARDAGASELPLPVRALMRATAQADDRSPRTVSESGCTSAAVHFGNVSPSGVETGGRCASLRRPESAMLDRRRRRC